MAGDPRSIRGGGAYFGGFYAKWSGPDFHYDLFWVFSDNLRNSVVLPWLIWGEPLPWLVDLIANYPILWKAAAAGHLITQAMPILAVLSLNKPWIRLFEGAVYAFGVAMLIAVMGSWGNLPWLWLVPLFIDWEYFGRKIGLRFPYAGPHYRCRDAGRSPWPHLLYGLC